MYYGAVLPRIMDAMISRTQAAVTAGHANVLSLVRENCSAVSLQMDDGCFGLLINLQASMV